MRSALNRLYNAAGALAALFMIGTLVMVLAGIIGRLGGIYLRGTDAYAGYSMAACGFLALAYTLKHGEHIRVSLLLERLNARARRLFESASLVIAVVISALLAFYSVRLVWQSWSFNDISQGVDATPLWIPQIGMALGCAILLIGFVDDLVMRLAGRVPSTLRSSPSEPSRVE